MAYSLVVALATLKNWLKREDLTPNKPGLKRSHTLNRGALKEWVANEPDAYLDEYAETLGSQRSTVAHNRNEP